MPTLEVRDLAKSYGPTRAVDGISFDIEPGEVFGLLGPNGAGKSTTINMIATLLTPDAGHVRVGGISLSHSADYKRRIGYAPQEASLSDRLTAGENLAFIGRLYDLRGHALSTRIGHILRSVGLADRADDLVETFSGGMKRRLNIALSLLHDPQLVLLDEPTAGVDPQARAYIFEIVESLARQGRAVLYTTHYMEEAQRLCARTAIMDHGRILALGTLTELVNAIGAKRDLVIRADGLTLDLARSLATKLGHANCVLKGDEAHISVESADHSLLLAARAADELGLRPVSISLHEPNLETVFLEFTGRDLRD